MKIVEIGNRIPVAFFVTSGKGQSAVSAESSHFQALHNAGIGRVNLLTYGSVLSARAYEIQPPIAGSSGCVMESVAALGTCRYGEAVTASLAWGWIVDQATSERICGIASRYSGSLSIVDADQYVRISLTELCRITVGPFSNSYILEGVRALHERVSPKKAYGTALVALCFHRYDVPVIGEVSHQ